MSHAATLKIPARCAAMPLRSRLIVLLLLTSAGCEGSRSDVAPTSPGATVEVRIQGQVIDLDADKPLPGAVVTSPSSLPPATTTADGDGRFAISVNLQPAWRDVLLTASPDGYEPVRTYVAPSRVSAAALKVCSRLTIHAGESLETRVFAGLEGCGDFGWPCRRVVVESPAGAAVDLEAVPQEGQGEGQFGLMAGPVETHFLNSAVPARRVTVAGGEVWLYGAGRVTLTATASATPR